MFSPILDLVEFSGLWCANVSYISYVNFSLKNCAFGHGGPNTTFIMSTSQPVNAPPTDVESSPPLSDEACVAFVKLVENYCVLLPKGQDTDDFHLETFRLCSAIGVSSNMSIFS